MTSFKYISLGLFSFLTGMLLMIFATELNLVHADTPAERFVLVDNVYAPEGFKSNESAEIIISGNLPNLCHKEPKIQTIVHGDLVKINVTSLYYTPGSPFCPMSIKPFITKVRMGKMQAGNYQIIVNEYSSYEKRTNMTISQGRHEDGSKSQEAEVALVDDVSWLRNEQGEVIVKLSGYVPSTCYSVNGPEVIYGTSDEKTISINPVMDRNKDFCPKKMVPFNSSVILNHANPNEKTLIYVKSMDGINRNIFIK